MWQVRLSIQTGNRVMSNNFRSLCNALCTLRFFRYLLLPLCMTCMIFLGMITFLRWGSAAANRRKLLLLEFDEVFSYHVLTEISGVDANLQL